MPLIMMGPVKHLDDLDEFDQCTCCGAATVLLLTFRAQVELISLCGNCIEALHKAYPELLRLRLTAGFNP